MNSSKNKAVCTLPLAAALLLAPALAEAAAVTGRTALQEKAAVYVHKAQVRGSPSPSQFGGDAEAGGDAAEADGVRSSSTSTSTAAPVGPASVTNSVTTAVVAQISTASAACEAVGTAYRTDCLAKELKALVKNLPAQGEYAAAREALVTASDELAKLSRQNRDYRQPRLQITVPSDSETKRRPVAAVKQESVAETNAKALAILEDTTTVLLRSAEGNSDVALHYQRIAQALNSSKVLLRSL
ncbi:MULTISPECIES: hypothetical protein [unclassified Leisingera]|uniref:hypothetical protein n=1 Tax=unclassified Leisingera TaxID=2614906 RepID=UPI000369D844|nr:MULTISPECIES: hypothetical protein [unclassified Leisingera]